MAKVIVEAKIEGTCSVFAVGHTKEDALKKIKEGDWEVSSDSPEWDAIPINGSSQDEFSVLDVEDLKC